MHLACGGNPGYRRRWVLGGGPKRGSHSCLGAVSYYRCPRHKDAFYLNRVNDEDDGSFPVFGRQRVETPNSVPTVIRCMISVEPLFVLVLVGLLGLFFFGFLLVRRTLMGLREGYEDGQR